MCVECPECKQAGNKIKSMPFGSRFRAEVEEEGTAPFFRVRGGIKKAVAAGNSLVPKGEIICYCAVIEFLYRI